MGGRQKALLPYAGGQTFLQKILSCCQGEVLLSLNAGQNFSAEGRSALIDAVPDIGPMGGLYTAFTQSPYEVLQLFPCDMPQLSDGFFAYMKEQARGHSQACIPFYGDRVYPLCGAYHRSVLPYIEQQIQKKDYKMLHLLERLKVKRVDLQYTVFKDKLFNINTPEDLQALHRSSPPCFAVCGAKNSGKTTLIAKLIREFAAFGKTCSVLKHTSHDHPFDAEGTDTFLHKEAGAEAVLIYSPQKFLCVQNSPNAEAKDFLPKLAGCDIILMEGFKGGPYPKIEVLGGGNPACPENEVLAYACSLEGFSAGVPVFSRDAASEIAAFIAENLNLIL